MENRGEEGGGEGDVSTSHIGMQNLIIYGYHFLHTKATMRKPTVALLLRTPAAQSWEKHPAFVCLPVTVSCRISHLCFDTPLETRQSFLPTDSEVAMS